MRSDRCSFSDSQFFMSTESTAFPTIFKVAKIRKKCPEVTKQTKQSMLWAEVLYLRNTVECQNVEEEVQVKLRVEKKKDSVVKWRSSIYTHNPLLTTQCCSRSNKHAL